MLDYARPQPGEKTERAVVTVTFLRMDRLPARRLAGPPAGATLQLARLSVPEYRAIYDEIGAPWLWWLRRAMPDTLLRQHLENRATAIHILKQDGETAGFFETDAAYWPDVNLNYFGLRREFIGRGLGRYLLDAAIGSVFHHAVGLRGMTVNTCTADHPRALPNYLAAGFHEIRRAKEVWDIPVRLGLSVPEPLRL